MAWKSYVEEQFSPQLRRMLQLQEIGSRGSETLPARQSLDSLFISSRKQWCIRITMVKIAINTVIGVKGSYCVECLQGKN